MAQDEYLPGDMAPEPGLYVSLNVFGTPTEIAVTMQRGETFPALPRGFSWRSVSTCSASDLRQRAARYRQMAAGAATMTVRDEMLSLAQRLEAMADQRSEG